jgi:hypothetical protein
MDRLKALPVIGPLVTFADARPRLAAWIVLSLGMVILLLVEARDVGLLFGQWLALIVASVLVAGLCVWIVTFEDSADDTAQPSDASTPNTPQA